MTYATGSATTAVDLANAFLAFAVANAGMTEVVRRTETINSQSHTVVCLQKGTRYWWFRFRTNTIAGKPGISSGGTTWDNIPTTPADESQIAPLFEPFTSYHFFTEGTVCHMAVEMSNGSYTHFSFGDMTKYGSWPGGQFVAPTNVNTNNFFFHDPTISSHNWLFRGGSTNFSPTQDSASLFYCPYNGNNYAYISGTTTSTGYSALEATGFSNGVYDRFINVSPNTFNNRAPGIPVVVFLRDNMVGGSGLKMPLGFIPNIRLVNIKNLNPKDVINTDWMVFPMQSKNSGLVNVYANSGNYGWAIKQ